MTAATLLGCLQAAPALAQAPMEEVAAGFTAFHLRPATGASQNLDGAFVGGSYRYAPAWSLEAVLSLRSATEASAVERHQVGLVYRK